MNKNRNQLPIYKSHAQRNNIIDHPAKLYGSGATVVSPQKAASKFRQMEPCFTKRESQTERAIDNISTFSRQSPSFCRNSHLVRSKSGEHVKWQSPTKQTICGQSFRSIIEEINQQNDRTFSQLDEDLKRIKGNLNRIQKQSEQAKQSSHCQALTDQIDLLQEENEKLRQKNLALTNEKRKMAGQIQQYETLIQRERIKQATTMPIKHTSNDSKMEDLVNNNRKLKQQLEHKDSECQKLKSQNSQLSNIKVISQKRQAMFFEEKNKLLSKISQLQKEKDTLKLRLEEQLTSQLQKKDAYYARIMKAEEVKYQDSIAKLKTSIIKSVQTKQQELAASTNGQIERLSSQIMKLKNSQQKLKVVQEQSQKMFGQCSNRIDILKNEIELLNFSYKQSLEQLNQKQEMISALNKRMQASSSNSKRQSQQLIGMRQRLEQQNKKSQFLQQLCNKLERQLQQVQYQSKIKQSNLSQAISDSEKQLHRIRLANEALKKENKDLENQIYELSRQNEKSGTELKRKTQQNITLKKQNLLLVSQRNNTRLIRNAYSPQKTQRESQAEIAQQRLQRLHSARESREQYQLNSLKEKQLLKMKKIEKQLNELVSECKSENERTKAAYREKQAKLQETINKQKQKLDDLNSKVQKLENELQAFKHESQQKQQNYRQINRKKQTEILLFERKQAESKLKISMVETQNAELKKKIQKLSSIKDQEKSESWQKKFNNFRLDYNKLLDTILKQITSISQNNISDSTNIRPKDFQFGCTELKSYEELHKIAEINYSIHTLKETFRSFHKKMKQNAIQAPKVGQSSQNSYFLQKSTMIAEQSQKQSSLLLRRNEKSSKHYEQQNQKILAKTNQLEKKYERLVIDDKRKTKQLQEIGEQYRGLKREMAKIKSEYQIMQDEKQDLRVKLKYCQQRLSKRQSEALQQTANEASIMAPTKEAGFYRQSIVQIERQSNDNRLRSRMRSFRSCEKRQNDLSDMRGNQKKIAQYELAIGKLNRMLEAKSEQLQQIEKEIANMKQRERKYQAKNQSKSRQFQKLEERAQAEHKQKIKLQSRVHDLQVQQKVLINEIEKIQTEYQQSIEQFQHQKRGLQRQIKQALLQRQIADKKARKEVGEKQQKYGSLIQQYELKIIDLASQSNKLKQGLNQMTMKNQSVAQKCDLLQLQVNKRQQKIFEYELKIAQMRERVQKQSKQKQNMLNIFSSNTTRLTKLLQEKQIEIQQLKFIQESTIINLEYARSQQNRKKHNESTYSFKNQF